MRFWSRFGLVFATHEILNKKLKHCELLRIMKQSVDPWYIARTWKPYQNFGWMIPKCIWRKPYPTISYETKKVIWKSSMNLSIGNLKVDGRGHIDVGDGNCLCWRQFSAIDDRFLHWKVTNIIILLPTPLKQRVTDIWRTFDMHIPCAHLTASNKIMRTFDLWTKKIFRRLIIMRIIVGKVWTCAELYGFLIDKFSI